MAENFQDTTTPAAPSAQQFPGPLPEVPEPAVCTTPLLWWHWRRHRQFLGAASAGIWSCGRCKIKRVRKKSSQGHRNMLQPSLPLKMSQHVSAYSRGCADSACGILAARADALPVIHARLPQCMRADARDTKRSCPFFVTTRGRRSHARFRQDRLAKCPTWPQWKGRGKRSAPKCRSCQGLARTTARTRIFRTPHCLLQNGPTCNVFCCKKKALLGKIAFFSKARKKTERAETCGRAEIMR